MMHARRLASFSSVDSVASKFCLLQLLSWGSDWQQTLFRSCHLPSEASFLLVYALFSVHSVSDQRLNVNLQVVELEQHIYRMMDVGRGVTKDRRTIYIYISHSRSSYPFMWGSLRLAPIISHTRNIFLKENFKAIQNQLLLTRAL